MALTGIDVAECFDTFTSVISNCNQNTVLKLFRSLIHNIHSKFERSTLQQLRKLEESRRKLVGNKASYDSWKYAFSTTTYIVLHLP